MLIPREELRFNFNGAQFDLQKDSDRKLLGWIFNQFLYGEVTGIQCGYWLYHAPHLNAAAFLARQAGEELSHVKRILRILSLLGEGPAPAHPAIRFLSTGMMGGSWGEHVAMEMALGEGLVLSIFYAMGDVIPNPEIKKILQSAVVDEEKHVEFGEQETQAWLNAHPNDKSFLLALTLLQFWVMKKMRSVILKKLLKTCGETHPVMNQFPQFYDHVLNNYELKIKRLGISETPLQEVGVLTQIKLIVGLPIQKYYRKFFKKSRLLTSTYLLDPSIKKDIPIQRKF